MIPTVRKSKTDLQSNVELGGQVGKVVVQGKASDHTPHVGVRERRSITVKIRVEVQVLGQVGWGEFGLSATVDHSLRVSAPLFFSISSSFSLSSWKVFLPVFLESSTSWG